MSDNVDDSRLYDALPVGVMVHQNTVITRVNRVAAEIFGAAPEDILGRTLTEFLSPQEAPQLFERYQRRMRGEQVLNEYEATIVRRDGRHRRVEVSITRYGEGSAVVMRDITERTVDRERRLALARLGASLHMHRTEDAVYQALRGGIAEVGLACVLFDTSSGAPITVFADLPVPVRAPLQRALGGSFTGRKGRWSQGLEEAARWGEAFVDDVAQEMTSLAGKAAGEVFFELGGGAGLHRAVLARLERVSGGEGVLALVGEWPRQDDVAMVRLLVAQLATALDNARALAEARRKEREVEAVNRLARALLAVAPESPARVLGVASTHMAEALNARSAEVLLLNEDGTALRGPDDPGGVELDEAPIARDVLAHNAPATIGDTANDPRAGRMDREERSQAVLLVPVASPRGARGIVTISDEVGRRFRDEEVALAMAMGSVVDVALENAALHNEARHRVSELSETQAQLVQQERFAALGELAAVMAHEVRNPLGVIFNSLGALARVVKPVEEAQVLLGILREEADRLNRIVGDLLDFARPLSPALRREVVASLVEEAVHAACVADPAATQIAVSLAFPEDLPTVPLDARLFRQALVNLCANAVQAMGGVGALAVTGTMEGSGVGATLRLDFADSGPGIPEAVRARIFEPFFTTKATGTGLGLAVVRRIVEAHGGALWVECPDAGGTVFSVRVPVAERGDPRWAS